MQSMPTQNQIELNPNYVKAYNNRGTTYYNLGLYNKAIRDFNKSIELNPCEYSYFYRGNSYYHLQQYEKAIQDYSEVIKLNPKFALAYFNRAVTYHKIGEYKKAVDDLNKAKELDQNLRCFTLHWDILD